MGEFSAGKMVIALIIYFFIYFLVITTIINSKLLISGGLDNRVTYDASGMARQQEIFNDPSYGECTGRGYMRLITKNILCQDIGFNCDTPDCRDECNNVSGCSWRNSTNIFGFAISNAACIGSVNKSRYNITGNRNEFCSTGGAGYGVIYNQSLCIIFGCTWMNQSELIEDYTSLAYGSEDKVSLGNIWHTVKDITMFRANLGLGSFNFIVIFITFYVPFVMLLISLYFSLPFLH